MDANMISSPVNYFQPDAQPFPTPQGTIPATYGQTASFFEDQGVWSCASRPLFLC